MPDQFAAFADSFSVRLFSFFQQSVFTIILERLAFGSDDYFVLQNFAKVAEVIAAPRNSNAKISVLLRLSLRTHDACQSGLNDRYMHYLLYFT
jgi:hypothetical protein